MKSNILTQYTKHWKFNTLKALTVPAALAGALNQADAQNLNFSNFKVNQDKNPFTKIYNNFAQDNFQFSYADVDGDGSKDLISGGNRSSKITFFKNIGTNSNPSFSKIKGSANPFDQIDVSNPGLGLKTLLADFDGDGKLEGIAALLKKNTKPVYLKNTGSNANPSFVEIKGTASPFNVVQTTNFYTGIAVADIDADGKMDVLASFFDINGYIKKLCFYKNITTSGGITNFEQVTGPNNPFEVFNFPSYFFTPAFGDVDSDGKMDMIIPRGNSNTSPDFYKNTSSVSSLPAYTIVSGTANPFNNIILGVGGNRSIQLTDINGDNKNELLVNGSNSIDIFKNTSSIATAPSFIKVNDNENIFRKGIIFEDGINNYSKTTFTDIDNDGDDDVFINQRTQVDGNNFVFLKNTAPIGAKAPAYQYFSGTNVPFKTTDSKASLSFADIDGDGIKEVLKFDNDNGKFEFYKNTGGIATNLSYVQIPTSVSPIAFLPVKPATSYTSFVDVDNDGKFDILNSYGHSGSEIQYFKNTGTLSTPGFAQIAQSDSPFPNTPFTGQINFSNFADLDNDGKIEAAFTSYNQFPKLYTNTGSLSAPAYVEVVGTNNPFSVVSYYYFNQVSFTDIDNDGDTDAIVFAGQYYDKSRVLYENTFTSGSRPVLSAASFNVTVGGIALVIPTTAVAASFTDADGQSPVKFKVSSLPTKGTLSISGLAAVLNQEYSVSSISSLSYLPNSTASGIDKFDWNATDGFAYAIKPATITINITNPSVITEASTAPESQKSVVNLYPVPAGNVLYANINKAYGMINAFVYDVSGSKVYETSYYSYSSTATLEIPTRSLTQGVYILKIETSDEIIQKRFVK